MTSGPKILSFSTKKEWKLQIWCCLCDLFPNYCCLLICFSCHQLISWAISSNGMTLGTPHHCFSLTQYCLLSLHYIWTEVMTRGCYHLLSTQLLPSSVDTSSDELVHYVRLLVLFDPFYARLNSRALISLLESSTKLFTLLTKWIKSQFKLQQVPWLQNLAVALLLRQIVWHPETPHAEGT